MAAKERTNIGYEAPRVTDLGTLAELTTGGGHSSHNSDNPSNDSLGKSA